MLKNPKSGHCNLLQTIISKKVESMADKSSNYAPNTVLEAVEIIGLGIAT
jgi:hypothetical protein